jgi:hypothetical protein
VGRGGSNRPLIEKSFEIMARKGRRQQKSKKEMQKYYEAMENFFGEEVVGHIEPSLKDHPITEWPYRKKKNGKT